MAAASRNRRAAVLAAAVCQIGLLDGLPLDAGGLVAAVVARHGRRSAPILGLRGGVGGRGDSAAIKGRAFSPNKCRPVDESASGALGAGYMGSLSVVFYLLTSLTLTLMNKLIFSQFQYPLFVTEFQVASCAG